MAHYTLSRDWYAPQGHEYFWQKDSGQTRSVLESMVPPMQSVTIPYAKPGDTYSFPVSVTYRKPRVKRASKKQEPNSEAAA